MSYKEIEIYSVVLFGCNSTPNDMWVPKTYIFMNKEEAFKFYKDHSPSLEDTNNRAEIQLPSLSDDYIECIMQVHGYFDGDGTCAKRPYGAKISCHRVTVLN